MRRTRQAAHDGRGTLPRRTILAPVVLLSAVLYGCAFFVPAVGTAAGITVEIIKPTTAPRYTFDTGKEYDFEAVAFVEGQELPGGEVSWEWSFGDGTDPVCVNPTTHTYAAPGDFTVVVTATYQGLSGQDTLNAQGGGGEEPPTPKFVFECGEVPGTTQCDQGHAAVIGENVEAFTAYFYVSWEGQSECLYAGQQSSDPYYRDGKAYRCAPIAVWWPGLPNKVLNWRVEIHYADGTREPDVTASVTPDNTVIKTTGDLVIKHTPGQQHEVSWSVTHLNHGNILFRVTAEVLDLGGSVIWSRESQQGIVGDSVAWHGEMASGPPEGGTAPKGLYTYRVRAEQLDPYCPTQPLGPGPCADCDKVEAISNVSVTDFGWTIFPDEACVTLSYTLSQNLSPCDLSLYKHDLSAGSIQAIKDMNGVVLPGLPSTSGQHQVKVRFAVDRHVLGNHYFVISGEQADGSANRDMQAKQAVPRGAIQTIWPPAWFLLGDGIFCDAQDIMASMGLLDDLWQTQYAVGARVPTAHQAIEAMRDGSVIVINAHANPNCMSLGLHGYDEPYKHILWGFRPAPGDQVDRPDADVYYLELQPSGALSRTLLVVLAGCHTWNWSGCDLPIDHGLVAALQAKGATNVLGFNEEIFGAQTSTYLESLFYHCMKEGQTLGGAHALALQEVHIVYGGDLGGVDGARFLSAGQLIKKARWP
jgi:hypothetical protein